MGRAPDSSLVGWGRCLGEMTCKLRSNGPLTISQEEESRWDALDNFASIREKSEAARVPIWMSGRAREVLVCECYLNLMLLLGCCDYSSLANGSVWDLCWVSQAERQWHGDVRPYAPEVRVPLTAGSLEHFTGWWCYVGKQCILPYFTPWKSLCNKESIANVKELNYSSLPLSVLGRVHTQKQPKWSINEIMLLLLSISLSGFAKLISFPLVRVASK